MGVWTSLQSIAPPENWARVTKSEYFSSGNFGYLGFGVMSTVKRVREFWQFDPQAMPGLNWKRMPDFPGEVQIQGSKNFTIGEKIYIGLGQAGILGIDFSPNEVPPFSPEFWEFTPPQN